MGITKCGIPSAPKSAHFATVTDVISSPVVFWWGKVDRSASAPPNTAFISSMKYVSFHQFQICSIRVFIIIIDLICYKILGITSRHYENILIFHFISRRFCYFRRVHIAYNIWRRAFILHHLIAVYFTMQKMHFLYTLTARSDRTFFFVSFKYVSMV